MDPLWQRAEELFYSALQQPESEREAWLASQTGGDSAVREEVWSLLAADRKHVELGAQKAATGQEAPAEVDRESELPEGHRRFGVWETGELLGRGGMGAVYLARRADGQFEQTVALKVMAPHLAGGEFLRKFQTERQLLASLEHPNITRLLDGGMSASGDPYLVMEYVEGQALDRYCDERELDVGRRLHLFLGICEAVDYAHRNLIVHRDLKPSNILVTAAGTAKLLDFGTASLTAQDRNLTTTRLRMVTPRYASPEQLRGERANPASDIFSMGVILYELLTGAWPFGDPTSVVGELQRAMGEAAPTSPSAAVTVEAAACRALPRQRLQRLLKGDLSAIVLKALENDPSRRYGTVRQFADDIERFLNGMPVQARPQTALYHAARFVRRRWLPVALGTVFVLGLIAAAIISVNQARVAREEARKAEKVNQFLNDMLSSAGEMNFDPQKFTVAQMLDSAASRLEQQGAGDPLIEATLRTSLGSSYSALQKCDLAKAQLEKARATFQRLGNRLEEARVLTQLGVNASAAGLPFDGIRYLREALVLLNRLGKDAPAAVVFRAKLNLADILYAGLLQHVDEARRLLAEAIELAERDQSIPRADLAAAITDQGGILMNEGKTAEAEAAFLQSIEIYRRENYHGSASEQTYYYLTFLHSRKRDFPGARDYARLYYEERLRNIGPGHARTAEAKILWARFIAETGDTKLAAEQALEAMPVARSGLPPLSTVLWTSLTNVSHILNLAGRFAEAEPYAREELAIIDNENLPETDGRRGQSLFELGKALHGEKKDREAAVVVEQALRIYEQEGPLWASSTERIRRLLDEIRARLATR